MAQAEAFETDFWKDANLRKLWDDIVPGEPRKTIPYTLTREAIELYCKSVGEDHPIYFDEAYARTTRYGGLIAPPSIHILLMFSCTPADDWMRSPGTVNAGQSPGATTFRRGPTTSSPCRRVRSTSSSSASGCSWCTTTYSSTSAAKSFAPAAAGPSGRREGSTS
jgi:hypothetical protein